VTDPRPGGIFAFLSDHRDWLSCIVAHHHEATGEVKRSSGAWNLVFCQDGDVLMRSHPGGRGGEDHFEELLATVRTRAVLGHFAPEGDPGEANALRSMGWIYVQGEETDGFEKVRGRLRHHLPDFLARSMRGKGEAEHLFHLILAFLYDSGKLSDPDLPASELGRGVRNALKMIDEVYPEEGLAPPSPRLVVSNCFSAAGYTGPDDLPVRVFERPGDEGTEVHRGVGVRRTSAEFPLYPRTGRRAIFLGSFIRSEQKGSLTGRIGARTLFGVTRSCEIETYDM
jgi:hypothetical protein